MIEETFDDSERRLLLDLAICALPRNALDALMLRVIAKLGGTDTQLVARRASPSQPDGYFRR